MANSMGYHEPLEKLSTKTQDLHRALVSVQEELEAVDWYRQRADACGDEELRGILLHNAHEEVEHAAMLLEWLRRRDESFAEQLSTYLFQDKPILEIEEAEEGGAGEGGAGMTVGSMKE